MHKRHDFRKAILYLLSFAALTSIILIPPMTRAYNCKSGDTECEEAKNNMNANRQEANSYIAKANSVSEIIAQLDSEIESINQMIAENESQISSLNDQIAVAEKELLEDQTALAEILINMHFNSDSEPITILASSESISDLAEKTAREEVVKREIAATSEKIKAEREELNTKKTEVEEKLAENQNNRDNVASKRSEQESLRAQYEKNADDAAIVADYWENLLKQLAYTPPSDTTGWGSRYYGALNSYPYQDNCPRDNVQYSAYGGAVCQCTSYASFKAYEKWGITNSWGGHAYNYIHAVGYYVPYTGIRTYVNRIAEAYTIAVMPASSSSPYGHVMWVEGVNDDGTINVTEYNVNWPSIGCYEGDFCSRNNVGTSGMYFVHFQ